MGWRVWMATMALASMSSGPLVAEDRIAIRVDPRYAFAPANLLVRTTVSRRDEHRWLEVVAESANFFRSSEVPLEGASAPRVSYFQFRGIPPGEYFVIAIVRGVNGDELARSQVKADIVDSEF